MHSIKKPDMVKTTVVNINKGEDYDVYIGREGHGKSGYFGNPINYGSRSYKINKFREYVLDRIYNDPEFKNNVKKLHGKRLGCFCKPLACHGDILAGLADQLVLEDEVFEVSTKGEHK